MTDRPEGAAMTFDVVFAIFVALMIVLAVFVVRFSIQLNKDRRGGGPRR